MWRLWRKANQFHRLPSEVFFARRQPAGAADGGNELEDDALAAWMLDNAVLTFGTLVENMLHETVEVEVGDRKQSKPRYSISQLLDPAFVFPRDDDAEEDGGGWDESTWDEAQLKADGKAINLNGIVGVLGLHFDEVK